MTSLNETDAYSSVEAETGHSCEAVAPYSWSATYIGAEHLLVERPRWRDRLVNALCFAAGALVVTAILLPILALVVSITSH